MPKVFSVMVLSKVRLNSAKVNPEVTLFTPLFT